MSLRPPTAASGSSAANQGVRSPSNSAPVQTSQPSEQEIQTKPWKYIGYPGYSEFIASDVDLLIFRRFNVLNARALLSLQDKVCELEQELQETDAKYGSRDAEDFNNGTFRKDLPDRAELLEQITETLSRYILQQSAMRRYPTAPARDIKNINRWHYNHGDQAIATEERQYIEHADDLISITEKDKTPLRQFIDSSRRLRTLPIWRRLSSNDTGPPQSSDKDVAYYSDKRINNFTSMTIVFIGTAMLLTPIWILQALQSPTSKLVVITIFILVFLITLSYVMVTKPFEALGSTAAYAAVLMVFLQVGGSD
ncbi:hypothetical protein PG996_006289 [Apiospora saccharicola]|uniref:DUF6594 domain-containing protein n=1 Tax=Apiospora saccharicola TaxID=335842 RepID=A0ABR1VNW1_9PEZI